VHDDQDTIRRKIEATAAYLDIWLMRRTVNYIRVGYSSTAYAMYLLCQETRRKPMQDLVNILQERLADDEVTFEGSPSKGRAGIDGLSLNQFTRRYIYHLLARLTAYTEVASSKPDLFDKYVDRSIKNPCDIEHIWAVDLERYKEQFSSAQEFETCRNHVAGLLLLPADVNRSFQDKTFEEKAPHYAKQNLFAASLTASAYQHQPQFEAFRRQSALPFNAYERFGKAEQLERRELVRGLVNRVWSPDRLAGVLV
jgi:hypothetical protein